MPAINTAVLISTATKLVHLGYEVQQDPAVQKAFKEAWEDSRQAGKSIGRFAHELNSARRRAERAGDTYSSGVYA
jgi:hypothetical protein